MRAYRIAYDGTGYRGFQRQPDVPTVEDAILDALVGLSVLDPDAEHDGIRPTPPGYAAAGRTDAGVSALAQTVAFDAPDWLTPRALNAELPADVRAWAVAEAPPEFHATHDAAARTYQYWLYAPAADPERALTATERLSGAVDVANLTADDDGTRRRIDVDCEVDGPYLVLSARAGGFPRQFVRRAVELVRSVAAGETPLSDVDRVLDPTPLPGPKGVPAAPPEPLVLVDVAYPDLAFAVDGDASADASAAFRRRRIDRHTAARVAGRIERGIDADDAETEADVGGSGADDA